MQHERPRPDGAGPPTAEAGHHRRGVSNCAADAERRAARREDESFGREQTPHLVGGEAHRSQQANLAPALLDSEPEEERRQHQRRDHEKEAEIREVLTEVGGAAGGGQAAAAHVTNGQAERERVDFRAQHRGEAVALRSCRVRRVVAVRHVLGVTDRMQPDRCSIAEPRSPQALTHFERYERLRRRTVLLPVVFVHTANAFQIDRKRRIPVAERLGFRDAGIHGHEVTVGGRAFAGNDGRDLKAGRAREQPPGLFPHVIFEAERIAGADAEIAGRPRVQHNRWWIR